MQNFNETFKKGVSKYFKKFMKFMKLSTVKISSPISRCNVAEETERWSESRKPQYTRNGHVSFQGERGSRSLSVRINHLVYTLLVLLNICSSSSRSRERIADLFRCRFRSRSRK